MGQAPDYAQRREVLQESVHRDEEDLRHAVEQLKSAVRHPLGLDQRIRANPIPWLFGGVLIGLWLGTRRG